MVLCSFILVPSFVTFFKKYIPYSNFIFSALFLYIPFFVYVCISGKNARINLAPLVLFGVLISYIFIFYFYNRFYDIYSDSEFGITRLLNGYGSAFIILFFCLKYDSKVLLTMLKVTAFALLLISVILLLKGGKKTGEDGYDMNVGYKLLLCIFEFSALAWFAKKRFVKIIYVSLAVLSFFLMLFFGSRGPLVSILFFGLLFYILFLSNKLSRKINIIFLIAAVSIVGIYVLTCVILSKANLLETLPRNLRTLFDPLSIFTSSTFISRTVIYKQILSIIKDTPFLGYGPLADQYFLGASRYSHNFYLEMWLTFGLFFGSILIIIFTIFFIKVLSLSDEYTVEVFCYMTFFCATFIRLMVSYSFWYDTNFWIAIGLGTMILVDKAYKDRKVSLIENGKNIMSKNCYFIHFGARKMPGVSKKITDQVNELSKHFITKEIDLKPKKDSFISKIIASLPFSSISRDYKAAFNEIVNPSFIYIRNTIIDLRQILFLRKLRKSYPSAKIVVELNTYPYDKCEFARKNTWIFFYKDFTYRHFYKFYINKFVVYGDFQKIWGVQTIKTINGIDLSNITKKGDSSDKKTVNLISVAQYQNHHGYDRLIKGISDYYSNGGKENIIYHVVGNGFSINSYKELVNNLKLNEYVIFYGEKNGKELDDIYDKCDIAIATLGFHRINVKVSSALKTREYLAKGLPIVYSGIIDIIDDTFKYKYCAPEGETNIDVNKIIELYSAFSKNRNKISKEIMEYVAKKASMNEAFKPIVSYFNEV